MLSSLVTAEVKALRDLICVRDSRMLLVAGVQSVRESVDEARRMR